MMRGRGLEARPVVAWSAASQEPAGALPSLPSMRDSRGGHGLPRGGSPGDDAARSPQDGHLGTSLPGLVDYFRHRRRRHHRPIRRKIIELSRRLLVLLLLSFPVQCVCVSAVCECRQCSSVLWLASDSASRRHSDIIVHSLSHVMLAVRTDGRERRT